MQNTPTSRNTDFRRQKTITSKTPLTLYGRGFCASDRTPTTTGLPAGPQSNQNVWVLPPISRNVASSCTINQSKNQTIIFCFRLRPDDHTEIVHNKERVPDLISDIDLSHSRPLYSNRPFAQWRRMVKLKTLSNINYAMVWHILLETQQANDCVLAGNPMHKRKGYSLKVSEKGKLHCRLWFSSTVHSFIFSNTLFDLENRFLVRLSSNFQERLLIPSSCPNLFFGCLFLL